MVSEREEELTDFVSTAKGVLQSLVEKHFPAPDRDKINRILGIGKPKSILDELGLKLPDKNGSSSKGASGASSTSSSFNDLNGGKRKRKAAEKMTKRMKTDWDALGSSSEEEKNDESDFEVNGSDHEDEDNDSDEDVHSEDLDSDDEDDFNPFGSGSDDDDDPWARRKSKKKNKKNAKKSNKKSAKNGNGKKESLSQLYGRKTDSGMPSTGGFLTQPKPEPQPFAPPKQNVDRACQMKQEILEKIEALGRILPPNTLDQLIDELGGPENVSEMTGRKGRVVQDQISGDVRYESRSEADIPLETLNLAEKDRFMNAEKDVAIISEAASSGISLQADRRVKNQVHTYNTFSLEIADFYNTVFLF